MQNKKIKNLFSVIFVVCFIVFLSLINIFENEKTFVKTSNYKNNITFSENKYGLFLSSLHADIVGDFSKLSLSYNEAVKQNNKDFLGKQLIYNTFLDDKKNVLKFASDEYKKNNNNIIPVMYLANNHFLKGEYKKAYNLYNNMKGKSDTFIVKLLKSWILIADKQYDDALDLLETEINNPAFRKYVLMHLGAQAEIVKDYEYADELYTEALTNEKLNLFDIENISAFYINRNNKKKAIDILKKYYEKTPDSISVLSLLSKIKKDTYKPSSIDNANKGMAKALFDLSFILSSVFTSVKDLHLMYLSMINDLYPNLYMAYIVKAEIFKSLNDTGRFLENLNKIPENHYLYLISSIDKILYDLSYSDNKEKTFESFENLIKKYPKYTHLYIKLADYYLNNNDYEKAINNYSKAITLTENQKLQANIYYKRAQVYDVLNNIEKAGFDLEKAYKLNKNTADFFNYYGYFLISNNLDQSKGLLLVAKAVTQEATNPYYLDSYGWALFKNGDLDKSINLLEFAKSIQPKNPVIIDHLADVYWTLGRKREAVFEWKKALNLKGSTKENINFNKIEYKINYGL